MDAIQSADAKIPISDFDVAAKAREIGNDVDKLFAFVRDEVRYEPYRGVLRGQGALMSRAGNSADKSMLLGALLRAHGYQVRIMKGSLAADKAQALLDQVTIPESSKVSESRQQVVADIQAIVNAAAGTTQDKRFIDQKAKWNEALAQVWKGRSEYDQRFILSKLKGSNAQLGGEYSARRTNLLGAVSDHFWLQVQRGQQWVDLDPSFPSAQRGQRFADPETTFAPDELPSSILHLVTFRVKVEHLTSQGPQTNQVFQASFASRDLIGVRITFANQPLDISDPKDLDKANKFLPVLRVGDKLVAGTNFGIVGGVNLSDNAFGAASGGLGKLVGQPSPQADKPILTGEWLEIEVASPNEKPRTYTREILDRIGIERRSHGGKLELGNMAATQSVPRMLLGVRDVLVAPGFYNESFVADETAEFALKNRKFLMELISARYTPQAASQSDDEMVSTSQVVSQLFPFFTAISALVSAKNNELSGKAHWYIDRPAVFIFKQAVPPASGTTLASDSPLEIGFDIVDHGVQLVERDALRGTEDMILFGSELTNLERLMVMTLDPPRSVYTPKVLNASTVFELAEQQGVGTRVIGAASRGMVEQLNVGRPARLRISQTMDQGWTVIVPERTVRVGNSSMIAWWRVDAGDGNTLGIGEDGEGQGATEESHAIDKSIGVMKALAGYMCAVLVKEKYIPMGTEGGRLGAKATAQLAMCIFGGGVGFYRNYYSGALTGIIKQLWKVAELINVVVGLGVAAAAAFTK